VKKLSSELSTCHDVIANLRNENASLIAKVDSNVCDASIPNLRDANVKLFAKIEELNVSLASLMSVFRPRGVPGPTSKLSPRVPAQMGRRETEHEVGNKETGVKGKLAAFVFVLRPGRVRLQ
jgi:hypothetical protein